MSVETAAPVAGADLDARVAMELLGWTMGHVPFGDVRYYDPEHVQFKGMIVFYPAAELPHFSTSLDAAWMVMEHLRLLGWHWRLREEVHMSLLRDVTFGPRWEAAADRLEPPTVDICADTLPLAICLVALEIKEHGL